MISSPFFTSDASIAITGFLGNIILFMSSITVPGTNISFFGLLATALIFSVFVGAFRRMLGMDFSHKINTKSSKASRASSRSGSSGGKS